MRGEIIPTHSMEGSSLKVSPLASFRRAQPGDSSLQNQTAFPIIQRANGASKNRLRVLVADDHEIMRHGLVALTYLVTAQNCSAFGI
jgi:hypothetical protein